MFQGLQEDQLAGALEAMLFVTDEPVGTIALAEMLECEVGAVEAALVRLRDDLEAQVVAGTPSHLLDRTYVAYFDGR